MALPLTGELPAREGAFRRFVLRASVAAVVAAVGLGGFIYYRNNSPHQLAIKAQLALEQHDPQRAVDFMTRALAKNPSGDALMYDRNLMAKAMIDAGREADARTYLQQVLADKPDNNDALDMMAESHVHPAFRKFQQAFKPISTAAAAEILSTIDEELGALSTLPTTPRNLVAQAELHHLNYLILGDQARQMATNEAAKNAESGAADSAELTASKKSLEEHRAKAQELLEQALKLDDKNAAAARLLAQYEYEHADFAAALAVYDTMKAKNAISQELAITAANCHIADSKTQPDHNTRFADAQKVLEAYLADHPKDPRVMVAIGQVMLEQNLVADAAKMASRANDESAGDLDAQILLIRARIAEKNYADALNLATPLTTSHSNVPQIWYELGEANAAVKNFPAAEDSLKKAISLNAGYLRAREKLLEVEVAAQENEAATLLAEQLVREDRYFIPAWDQTIKSWNRQGQFGKARASLISLAQDPGLPREAMHDVILLLADNNLTAEASKLVDRLPANASDTTSLRAAVAVAGGNSAAARDLMAKALAADAGNNGLRLQYGGLLLEANRSADARVQFDQVAAAKASLSPDQGMLLARGYLMLRLPNQASDLATDLLKTQPKNPDALRVKQDADRMLAGGAAGTEPAAAAMPQNANGAASSSDALQLTNAALEKKDYAQALSLARSALSRDTGNAQLHLAEARALAGLGQYDQAVDEIAAAATTQASSPEAFSVFVDLFPDADAAAKGLAYAGRLLSINPALGDWAMGRLAEKSGQSDLALRYYADGIAATNQVTDPMSAKGALYGAVLATEAAKKDTGAIKKSADQFAKDASFAINVRIAAAGNLLTLGDRAGAEDQLTMVSKGLRPTGNSAPVVLKIAQSWLAMGHPDKAQAVIESQIDGGNKDPALLAADASLLQQSSPEKALAIIEQLCQQDPGNPQYRVALGQIQALMGDDVAAFKTFEEARGLGETGKQLATTARLRTLISLGLLKEAGDELAAHGTQTRDDFASMLAIGEAWAQVHKPDEAKKVLAAIPSYAAEHTSALIDMATLELDVGHTDAAVEALKAINPRSPSDANQVASALFHAYIRAGNGAAALDLAKGERDRATPGSAPWTTATLYGVAAAREARRYDDAATLLLSLDPVAQKQSALDLAQIQLLQNKTNDAGITAAECTDTAPAFMRTTIKCLAGSGDAVSGKVWTTGMPSSVYAALSMLPPPQQVAQLPAIARNPHLVPGDVEVMLKELAATPDTAAARLRAVALSQRLLESGWTSTVVDLLDVLDKAGGQPLTVSMVQRHQALTDLRKTAEADKVRDQLAGLLQQGDVAPSVRILIAASFAVKEDYANALKALEPLAPLNRPEVLTTLATFHEKLGDLDGAIALHRQVRKIDPNNILAANNLAYTLAAAHPTDKAALAEASEAINFAISKAPQLQAFQDTLGWIEILSGKAEDGTKRITKALPSMRLDPAVHYHVGVGYARMGEKDLARMHLQDVAILAESKKGVPEVPLAEDALKGI